MKEYKIKQGFNIPLKGEAKKELRELLLPKEVCVQPTDYKGLRPRLIVKVGDKVQSGQPLFVDKEDASVGVCAPLSGEVIAIVRGEKRVLEKIILKTDTEQRFREFRTFDRLLINQLTGEKVMEHLCETGLWPVIRQRPFSRVASRNRLPKAIYVNACSTEPLAADNDFILQGQEPLFQLGLDIIGKLTKKPVYLCIPSKAQSSILFEARGVNIYQFSGPHPSGNVSTHISRIDPLNKGDIVWYVNLQDVIRIAKTFLEGRLCSQRIVALTGEGLAERCYIKTVIGAPLKELCGNGFSSMRCISGSVLTGKDVGADGYLCAYDSQISVISDQVKRHLLGWMSPGKHLFSLSRAFLSSFRKQKDFLFDTDTHGSKRAIVAEDIYNRLTPLNIYVNFLVKAILAGDWDEAEKLGLLECDPEDFALCSFACPSKVDIAQIVGEGLLTIEKEIY